LCRPMDPSNPYGSLDPERSSAPTPSSAPGESSPDKAWAPPDDKTGSLPPPPPPFATAETERRPGPVDADDVATLPRWNWSGFLVPPLFAIVNRLWLWLAAAMIPFVLATFDLLPAALLRAVQMAISVTFAMSGNPYAWRARRWDDMAHFRRVQRQAGWVALAITVVLTAVLVMAIVATETSASQTGASTGPAETGAGDAGTYAAHGITLSYPSGWRVDPGGVTLTNVDDLKAASLWLDGFVGPDPWQVAGISAVDAGSSFTRQELEADPAGLAADIGRIGALVGKPRIFTLGRYPAVRFQVTLPTGATTVRIDGLILYVGDIQILATCQSPGVDAASCTGLLGSIRVDDAGAIGSPSPAP